MRKKTAIALITKQKEKITSNILSDKLWLSQTASYIESIFGKDSEEIILIKSFKPLGERIFRTNEELQNTNRRDISRLNSIMDNYIETVIAKGVIKRPKTNFLNRLSDTWLTALFGLIVPALFFSGYWCGQRDLITFDHGNKQEKNKVIPKQEPSKQIKR